MDSRYLHNLPHPCRLRPLASLSLTWPFGPPSPEGRGVSDPHGTTLSVDSVATQVCSPDGAERNPGMDGAVGGLPRISLSLHAGYSLHLSPRRRILGQRCLR